MGGITCLADETRKVTVAITMGVSVFCRRKSIRQIKKEDTEDTKGRQSNNIFARYSLTIKGGGSHVRMDKRRKGMKLVKVISPRQTSIYVMCPWDHDILSLLFTTPSEPCQKMLM